MNINSRANCKTHHVGRMWKINPEMTSSSGKGSPRVARKFAQFLKKLWPNFQKKIPGPPKLWPGFMEFWFDLLKNLTWFSKIRDKKILRILIITSFSKNVTWLPENMTQFSKNVTLFPEKGLLCKLGHILRIPGHIFRKLGHNLKKNRSHYGGTWPYFWETRSQFWKTRSRFWKTGSDPFLEFLVISWLSLYPSWKTYKIEFNCPFILSHWVWSVFVTSSL